MTFQGLSKAQSGNAADRLIVALDVANAAEACKIVEELDGLVTAFKIGLQVFTSAGPDFVKELTGSGKKIFLDLKFHDIPNTTAMAAVEAARLGVWMFNVHASGGREMMTRTVAEVKEVCRRDNLDIPLVIGVTVLTSHSVSSLSETGNGAGIDETVRSLASMSAECGLDGVVASAKDVTEIRDVVADPEFLIVTPGIRPNYATNDDQQRVMTPADALLAGSDFLVVGRPIIGSPNRVTATQKILDEIDSAKPKL